MPVLPGNSSINWVWERFLFLMHNSYISNIQSMGFTAMQHYLYISKSKGGKQYLDSLGGSCNVTNEGSYRKEMVMMLAGEGGKA